MRQKLFKLLQKSQSGDTIVEVTLALTVLSLVLGTSTVLANRNARTLQNAQEKNIALRLAQEQLEFLKTRVAADEAILTSAPASFCMTSADTNPVASTSANCRESKGGATYQKTIVLRNVPNSSNQLFDAKATVEWETLTSFRDSSGNLQNLGRAQLSYRAYTKLGAARNPTNTICGPGLAWDATESACKEAPKATLNASAASIIQGNSVKLTWSSQHVSTCTASWGGILASGGGLDVDTSGTSTVSPTSSTSYTIVCSGARGSATASVTVSVAPPKPPRMPLYVCYQFNHHAPTPHLYKSNHIYTTNINNCDDNGYEGGTLPKDEHGRLVPTGYVPYSTNAGVIPMYSAFNEGIWDDFYTVDHEEYRDAVDVYHYKQDNGVAFYVYPYTSAGCTVPGTVPLYRWYSEIMGNHVYIPNTGDPNGWPPQDGGGTFIHKEGIAACIFSEP